MSDSWNNVHTVCCKPWLVLPTVYSDALSYGEQLDKFCYSLNKLIENNNILPEYIAEQIKEYISSGAIGEVVREILANYILNVKYPPKGITPAVGDGSADDTEALQGCIDYASENGGVVYFPYGSYLTQPLTMKSGVSLFGFDRYSTKVVLKGGATKALLNGNANGLSVCGVTLDGNSGIQVNNVNVVDMTGSDLMFNELIIKDGYKLFEFVGDGHLQLNDIVFGNAVENCFSVDGNVIVQAKNLLFMALSKVGGVSVIDIKANGGKYDFNSVAKCDTCMMISGNDNKIVALIGGASEDYIDTGEHNNVEIVGHSQKEYYSGNVKKDANNSETTLHGTRSLHVVGESTVAIDNNSTESVDGSKSEVVTGVSSAEYKADRTVKGTNENETFTGKKVINAQDIVLNSANSLTYKTPTEKNIFFNTIKFKDKNNLEYDVLVGGDNIDNLPFKLNNEPTNLTFTIDKSVDVTSELPTFYTNNSDIVNLRNTRKKNNIIRIASCNADNRFLLNPKVNKNGKVLYNKIYESLISMLNTKADILIGNEITWNLKHNLKSMYNNEYLPYITGYSCNKLDTEFPLGFISQNYYIDGGWGHYGNIIMSAIELSKSGGGNIAKATGQDEGRGYVFSEISVYGKKISIYGIHWDYATGNAAKNIESFANIVKNDPNEIIIIAGDWNADYLTESYAYSPLIELGFTVTNTDKITFPWNNKIIDNVLVKGNVSIVTNGIVIPNNYGSEDTDIDHYFYYVDIKIN